MLDEIKNIAVFFPPSSICVLSSVLKSSFLYTNSVYSGQEPRNTIHVYGRASSPDMTMEPFGPEQDTFSRTCVVFFCVGASVWTNLLSPANLRPVKRVVYA